MSAKTPPRSIKRVLFVCVGNSCRSPMAEALARHHASDVMEAESAGVSPFGRIADMTRWVLHERGIETGKLRSKGIRDTGAFFPDLVVNMSGIPGKSLFAESVFEDWDVEDPWGEDVVTYRRICEDIEERVKDLAARLRRENAVSLPADRDDAR